jgi:hypothetical protein
MEVVCRELSAKGAMWQAAAEGSRKLLSVLRSLLIYTPDEVLLER